MFNQQSLGAINLIQRDLNFHILLRQCNILIHLMSNTVVGGCIPRAYHKNQGLHITYSKTDSYEPYSYQETVPNEPCTVPLRNSVYSPNSATSLQSKSTSV